MNKRQIKKRVKQAKLKKERGLVLSPEEQHFIRNYGKRYYTEKELAYVLINWDAMADSFQMFADALRTGGREE